jgi:hypothetical protein
MLCLVSRSRGVTALDLDLPPGDWRDLETGEVSEGGMVRFTWQGARILEWEGADAVQGRRVQIQVGQE